MLAACAFVGVLVLAMLLRRVIGWKASTRFAIAGCGVGAFLGAATGSAAGAIGFAACAVVLGLCGRVTLWLAMRKRRARLAELRYARMRARSELERELRSGDVVVRRAA